MINLIHPLFDLKIYHHIKIQSSSINISGVRVKSTIENNVIWHFITDSMTKLIVFHFKWILFSNVFKTRIKSNFTKPKYDLDIFQYFELFIQKFFTVFFFFSCRFVSRRNAFTAAVIYPFNFRPSFLCSEFG